MQPAIEPTASGDVIDGFTLGELLHAGRMSAIYAVAAGTPFPAVMKLPHLDADGDLENLIAYEVESMVLPALRGLRR